MYNYVFQIFLLLDAHNIFLFSSLSISRQADLVREKEK